MRKDREIKQGETTGIEPKFSSSQNKRDLANIFHGDPKMMYPRRSRSSRGVYAHRVRDPFGGASLKVLEIGKKQVTVSDLKTFGDDERYEDLHTVGSASDEAPGAVRNAFTRGVYSDRDDTAH